MVTGSPSDLVLSMPDEILLNILHFIPPTQLDDIFLLDQTETKPNHNYYQKLAIYARYYKSKVTINSFHPLKNPLQNSFGSTNLSILQLKYLQDNNLFIQPRSIEIILQGICIHNKLDLYIGNFHLHEFILVFEKFLSAIEIPFNILMNIYKDDIYSASSYNENLPFSMFLGLIKVEKISIIYKRLEKLNIETPNQFQIFATHNLGHVDCESQPKLKPQHLGSYTNLQQLKLSLYNSSSLMNHIINNPLPEYSLKVLDLSYNNISDGILMSIAFPKLVTHLNLSNNNISQIYPFGWHGLESLNLSNNNISTLCSNYRIKECFQTVTDLYLGCNYILNSSLQDLEREFPNLINLDLSRNMLTYSLVLNFPKLQSLNLQGNRNLVLKGRTSNLVVIDTRYCWNVATVSV